MQMRVEVQTCLLAENTMVVDYCRGHGEQAYLRCSKSVEGWQRSTALMCRSLMAALHHSRLCGEEASVEDTLQAVYGRYLLDCSGVSVMKHCCKG